jgi:hypothetical protein
MRTDLEVADDQHFLFIVRPCGGTETDAARFTWTLNDLEALQKALVMPVDSALMYHDCSPRLGPSCLGRKEARDDEAEIAPKTKGVQLS